MHIVICDKSKAEEFSFVMRELKSIIDCVNIFFNEESRVGLHKQQSECHTEEQQNNKPVEKQDPFCLL